MGFDLAGDAFSGTNTPVPGPDPMDCIGHGTHAAVFSAPIAMGLRDTSPP